jgi:Putative Ig domain/Galactose oxidase, central domain
MKKSLLVLISSCCLWLLNGCGSGSSTQTQDVATHFSIMAATSTPTAGKAFNITVTALDATGQMVATYSGTVQLTSSNGQAVQPASGTLTNGTGTFSVTLNTAGSQSITATAASLTGTSSALTVSATVATQFSVNAPATATAGTPISFTVTARDVSNNVVTSYSGTVHITSSDSQAALPANATLTNGTGTFQITLKTANGETITATDTATASITGSSTGINVGPGAATHLSVSAPTAASAGMQFGFTVTAYDTYNNVATGYTGMVHFSTTDTQVVPPSNAALPNGSGSFPITLKTVQNTTITATDTTTSSITGSTSPIAVVSNAATHLGVGYPGSATTRAMFNIAVSALDAANNISMGYSGTVKFTSSDSNAHLPANSTLTNGAQTFSTTFESPGSQTITATDTVTPSLTITSNPITVTAPATLAITSSTPPSGTFGVNYGPTTIQYYKCYYRVPYGYSCAPCTGTTGCSSLPSCYYRYTISPCVEKRGTFVGFTLTATGGVQPYKWSASGLPSGLSVNASNGELTGTPTSAGTFTVVVTVTDSGTPTVASPSSNYTIVINDPPPPVINATPAPPSGAVNLPYSFTFTASSAAAPFTWRVSVGTLPAGLTLNPDGVLSGTPTATGTSSITLIATDEFKQDSAPQAFNIQIFANGFVATGSMATARVAATATLLNTGKVLVAGGTDPTGKALASAELYDPASKAFSATGSMGVGRDYFAATLLPSGKVLVTGGLDSTGNPLASAELYDPAAGTFSPTTGNMIIARASHTAILLNTGKVLITGWGNAIAELFDPSTGSFTQTGSMVLARTAHTATLLSDGRVLIAGGLGASAQALAEAELYDPASGSFSQTLGKLATARELHTATLLKDGTVLLTGGLDSTGKATATAELFNLTNQSFTAAKGNMETPRAFHAAILLNDGTVLVTGGNDGTSSLATAEVYDPTAGTFSPTGSMVSTRQSHTATLLKDGTVLVTGGTNGTPLATAELYK